MGGQWRQGIHKRERERTRIADLLLAAHYFTYVDELLLVDDELGVARLQLVAVARGEESKVIGFHLEWAVGTRHRKRALDHKHESLQVWMRRDVGRELAP